MNEGIHLDLDTWIVPGQIRKANLCRGLGNRYTPAGTEVLISAVAHNTPPIIIIITALDYYYYLPVHVTLARGNMPWGLQEVRQAYYYYCLQE